MLNLVMSQKSSQAEHDLLMDYLRRSVTSPGTIRVYNADLAITIARWGSVPYRKIELSTVEANIRPIYAVLSEVIDRVADDKGEVHTFLRVVAKACQHTRSPPQSDRWGRCLLKLVVL